VRLHRLAPCAPLLGAKTTSHELPSDLESVLTSSAVSVDTLLSVVVLLQFAPDILENFETKFEDLMGGTRQLKRLHQCSLSGNSTWKRCVAGIEK